MVVNHSVVKEKDKAVIAAQYRFSTLLSRRQVDQSVAAPLMVSQLEVITAADA